MNRAKPCIFASLRQAELPDDLRMFRPIARVFFIAKMSVAVRRRVTVPLSLPEVTGHKVDLHGRGLNSRRVVGVTVRKKVDVQDVFEFYPCVECDSVLVTKYTMDAPENVSLTTELERLVLNNASSRRQERFWNLRARV